MSESVLTIHFAPGECIPRLGVCKRSISIVLRAIVETFMFSVLDGAIVVLFALV